MAGIAKKGDAYYCSFRFRGRRFYFTIGKVTEAQARAKATEVDETLDLVERGRLAVPADVPFEDFVAAGGKVPVISVRPETVTARQLFDAYLTTHSNGTVEENSLATLRSHLLRVSETVGDRFRIHGLALADLQRHVERRRRQGISAMTLKKEISTLRACWNWALHGKFVTGPFPGKGLRFPKEEDKQPFRSFAEIRAIIEVGKPDPAVQDALWECLYLTKPEVEEFLAHVEGHATMPWVFPMVAFAAYTGARRSEMLRALAGDVDLPGGTVTVREKKRVRGKVSHRTVPLSPRLTHVLREWLSAKPDCPLLFCQATHVARSRTKRTEPTAITKDVAHDHFTRTVEGSKWEVVRGYHVLRHSFISALASGGVDQRVIDEMVGHQSEEQRRRYRHLYPKVMQDAISRTFG